MNPEDRDLLLSLRQQQAELQKTLERLNVQLHALENRSQLHTLPPLPVDLPPIPTEPVDTIFFPPIPTHTSLPPPPVKKASFEWHFGRWLMRFGAVILVLFFFYCASWFHFYDRLGTSGKLGLLGLLSMLLVVLGQRFERRKPARPFMARSLMCGGLGLLYFTICAACFVTSVQIISSTLVAGVLLFIWSLYVFYLAERRNSELLALFSITLAYFGTALNPDPYFSLAANLILAATSVAFLLRMGWSALPTFAIIGTYFALFRRLVIDDDGALVLDTSRTLPFWPYALYLYAAWLIFTLAVILTNAPDFRGMRRLAFVTLNNVGLAALMALTAYIAGYGAESIGETLLDTGLVFLIASRPVGYAAIEPVELMSAYATQGLALVTAGIVVVFTGITRVLVLLVETFLFGVAGAFAGDRVLTIATYIAAAFATFFTIWEIAVYAHHPWLLGFGGAFIMLINAWNCRSEVRASKVERSSTVFSTSCYCLFAVALIFSALACALNDSTLPPALAIAALVLTFLVYQFSIFELPALAQFLLLAALALVLFPAETGEDLPWWSTGWVGVITLVLVTYWSRQRFLLTGGWKTPLNFIYALALVDFTVQAIHPWCDAESWMVACAFLSFAFLAYGAFTRTWAIAGAGQFFLFLSLYHFFAPPRLDLYPWSWLAAAVPVIVTYITARVALEWLRIFTEIRGPWRESFTQLARWYLIFATFGVARWIFGILPEVEHVPALLFLGTFLLSNSVRHGNLFGVRCSFFLTALGMALYFCSVGDGTQTFLCGFAVFLALFQPALLKHEGKSIVTPAENWLLVFSLATTGWLFASAWAAYHPRFPGQEVTAPFHSPYLTLAWTLYAFFLFVFGLVIRERRYCRWAVLFLVLAILRVFGFDFWGFSGGFRVLTLFVLAIAALVIGFALLRRDHRNTL